MFACHSVKRVRVVGGGKEGIELYILKFLSHPNLDQWTCMIMLLMYNITINEAGCEGRVALGNVLAVQQTLQTLRYIAATGEFHLLCLSQK